MEDRSWTYDEETHQWTDEFGTRYSEDKKTILRCPDIYEARFVIHKSVTSIGYGAFRKCYWLMEIIIPDSVTSIGDDAFKECSRLEKIIIPKSVTSIGNGAFGGCFELKEITIPNSVTMIGRGVFKRCSGLSKIIIPDSVTNIGNDAFWDCSRLEKIIIPESVTSIGNDAFRDCFRLEKIIIPKSVTSIGNGTFGGCSQLKEITIPNSVTMIGSGVFKRCSGLSEINIPNSVTSIGNRSFMDCSNLKEIIIPKSVTRIGKEAFRDCSNLKKIIIPNSVTRIGEGAFQGCSNLKEIYILNRKAFSEFKSQSPIFQPSFNFDEKKLQWEDRYGVRYSEDGETIEKCPENYKGPYKILNGVTIIKERAFEGCSRLEGIVIPDSVVIIGDDAFAGCSRLESVCMPASLDSIGKRAFTRCSKLETIEIPQVVIIEEATFANCSRLNSVNFTNKDSVKCIGKMAFSGCTSLESIDLPDSVTRIEDKAFSGCSSLNSFNVPTHVIYIGKEAFSECSRLENIKNYTSTSVKSIEYGTFSKCTRLEEIVIPNTVTTIDDYAFAWCSSLKSIIIHEGITKIGNSAFYGCNEIRKIDIPESVKEIDHEAFWGCPIKEVRLSADTNYQPNSFDEVTKVVKAKVFISYSWDDKDHKEWIVKLALDLNNNGVSVILDDWDLAPGEVIPDFMEKSIAEAEKVILILTPDYKKKSEKEGGGVRYEVSIIKKELFKKNSSDKFIPILRKGSKDSACPKEFEDRFYLDFTKDEAYDNSFNLLLRIIFKVDIYKNLIINTLKKVNMEQIIKNPKVFISYSWDNQTHENWVLQLAADLRNKGVDVILDKWENGLGADIPHFMDTSVRESDRVLCILTPRYKEKANNLKGGVGYEYRDMTAEIFANIPTNKFIPVLRKGTFEDSIPTALSGRVAIDMRLKRNYVKGLEEILRELFNKPKYKKPPPGEAPNFD